MNAAYHDPLRARVQALEQEIKLLQQGVRQATRMRQLWEQALDELQAAKQHLDVCDRRVSILCRMSGILAKHTEPDKFLDRVLDALADFLDGAEEDWSAIYLLERDMVLCARCRGVEAGTRGAQWEDVIQQLAAVRDVGIACPVVSLQADEYHRGDIVVPLRANDRLLGFYCYCHPSERVFDAQLAETLIALGTLVAAGIESRRADTHSTTTV